eukprot:GDKI01041808.1.p1 GENE.GDKI01041808.1~~GDKI01041808.1.p1  ORF type:complete len:104 (+),score=19.42 GDKI01041808.1:298-609(+)
MVYHDAMQCACVLTIVVLSAVDLHHQVREPHGSVTRVNGNMTSHTIYFDKKNRQTDVCECTCLRAHIRYLCLCVRGLKNICVSMCMSGGRAVSHRVTHMFIAR